MDINKMIFSDGKVESYKVREGNVELVFEDYCGNRFTISFVGLIMLEERGSIGFDLSDCRLSKAENKLICEFLDDDLSMVLRIECEACNVSE